MDETRSLRVDIAHEMLIVGWPASREWVQTRRDAEKTRRRLVAKAEEWVRLGRREGGLLDSAELAEADAWLKGPDAPDLGVDADVQTLVADSHEAIDREAREKEGARLRELKVAQERVKLLLGSALVFGILSVGMCVATVYALRARTRAAEKAAEVSVVAGGNALEIERPTEALHRFVRALADLPSSSPIAPVLRRHTGLLARGQFQVDSILEHPSRIRSASISPDGKRAVTISEADTAQVWDVAAGRVIAQLEPPKPTAHLPRQQASAGASSSNRYSRRVLPATFAPQTAGESAARRIRRVDLELVAENLFFFGGSEFNRDGTRIFTRSSDGRTVCVWQADNGRLIAQRVTDLGLWSSPDATLLVVSTKEKTAQVIRVGDGKILAESPRHEALVDFACFSPDGSRVITKAAGTARLWKSADGMQLGSPFGCRGVRFSSDGSRLASIGPKGQVHLWNAEDGTPSADFTASSDDVRDVVFSPDGSRLLTIDGRDNGATLWETRDQQRDIELRRLKAPIQAIAFSPDGRHIAVTYVDGLTRIWVSDTGQFNEVVGEAGPEISLVFIPKDVRMMIRTVGGVVRVVRAAVPRHILALERHGQNVVYAGNFSRDGTKVVTASDDGMAWVSDTQTGKTICRISHTDNTGNPASVAYASFNHDGTRLVTAGWNGILQVWDCTKGKIGQLLFTLDRQHTKGIWSAVFSPDGLHMLTASADGTAILWRSEDGQFLERASKHEGAIHFADFSPDGRRIVTASADGTAKIWNPQTLAAGGVKADSPSPPSPSIILITPDDKPDPRDTRTWIATAVFSPDGNSVLTCSAGGGVRIWAAQGGPHGQLLREFKRAGTGLQSALFNLQGNQIITSRNDGAAYIWKADDGNLLNILRGHQSPPGLFYATFSSDSALALTTSRDGTSTIWKLDDGFDLGMMWSSLAPLLDSMQRPGTRTGRSCSRTATNAPSCTSGIAHSTPPLLPAPSISSPSHRAAA